MIEEKTIYIVNGITFHDLELAKREEAKGSLQSILDCFWYNDGTNSDVISLNDLEYLLDQDKEDVKMAIKIWENEK